MNASIVRSRPLVVVVEDGAAAATTASGPPLRPVSASRSSDRMQPQRPRPTTSRSPNDDHTIAVNTP